MINIINQVKQLKMAIQIQFRRGTASEWTAANPVLALAEMGIETDTDLFKIGNGIQQWNSLDYGGVQGYTGSQGVVGYTGSSAPQVATNVLYVAKNGNDTGSNQLGIGLVFDVKRIEVK